MHSSRLIALTDIETTGDIPRIHEILEIGLVVFREDTFEIVDTWNAKIKPEHMETAVPEAISYNGYTEERRKDAMLLTDAMTQYGAKTQETTFAAYNVSFDWMFILDAFHKAGLPNPMSTRANHDRLDVLTMAYLNGLKGGKSLSLKTACELFGVAPEPEPHTALDGAKVAYEVWKKIAKS